MQGGLVTPTAGYQTTTVGTTGPPSVTGSPELPQSQNTQSNSAGRGPGVSTSVDVAEMGPVDRLLAGSDWTRADVDLVLQTISTVLLLYWAMTEVQR